MLAPEWLLGKFRVGQHAVDGYRFGKQVAGKYTFEGTEQ
jgi:hypothetical protein